MNDVKERSTPRKRREARCDDGGGRRDRTDDLLLAKQALSQLSYAPEILRLRSGLGFRSARSRFRLAGANRLHPKEEPIARKWWAREDLNLRPHAYQARALTS